MMPELRGAAFALVLAFPNTPSCGEGESQTCAPAGAIGPVSLPEAAALLDEPVGIPLASFLALRELEVIRTTRRPRPELRNIRRDEP